MLRVRLGLSVRLLLPGPPFRSLSARKELRAPAAPPAAAGGNRVPLLLSPHSGKASRWFGVAQSKSAKTTANILQQEELIAQKKREIEARLEQQARQSALSLQQLPLLGECVWEWGGTWDVGYDVGRGIWDMGWDG